MAGETEKFHDFTLIQNPEGVFVVGYFFNGLDYVNIQISFEDIAAKIQPASVDQKGITQFASLLETLDSGVVDKAISPKSLAFYTNQFTAEEKAKLFSLGGDPVFQTAAETTIEDAGGYYTATQVEDALQEAAASLANKIDVGSVFTHDVITDFDTAVAASPAFSDFAAHIINLINPHQTTLEQVRTQNNELAGDIDFGGFNAVNTADAANPQDAVNLRTLQALLEDISPTGRQIFDGTEDPSITPPDGAVEGAYYFWHPTDGANIIVKRRDETAWQTQFTIHQNGGGGDSGDTVQAALAVKIFKTGNQSIANNTNTVVAYDQQTPNPSTIHSNSTNNSRITFDRNGWINISGQAAFASSAGGILDITIVKNGVTVIGRYESVEVPATASIKYVPIVASEPMGTTDYIEMYVKQTSGGAIDILGAESGTWLSASIVAEKGEQGVQGNEGVGAGTEYSNTAFISHTLGSDSSGMLGNPNLPYKTFVAVYAAGVATPSFGLNRIIAYGDVIEDNILKSGFTVEIHGNLTHSATPTKALIDDDGTSVLSSKLYVFGDITGHTVKGIVNCPTGSSFFQIYCSGDIYGLSPNDFVITNPAISFVNEMTIQANSLSCNFNLTNCGQIKFDISGFFILRGAQSIIDGTITTIDNCTLNINTPSGGLLIRNGSNVAINGCVFIAVDLTANFGIKVLASLLSIDSCVADLTGGGASVPFLLSDNSTIIVNNCYDSFDCSGPIISLANGGRAKFSNCRRLFSQSNRIVSDSSTPNATALQFYNCNLIGNTQCLNFTGSAIVLGKCYVTPAKGGGVTEIQETFITSTNFV